ncbi:eukaryotic translation initiation factor 5B-like [Apium graveolens]|uniref:eukaryotic translation initiation factor 5B-like n=1 Tax=Apium graveolens TaxID=4045 RepID=UPI003D7BF2FE
MFTRSAFELLEDDNDENLGVQDRDGYGASSKDDDALCEDGSSGTSVSGRMVDDVKSKDTSDGVVVSSKSNKRRKKGGRTEKEDDDLDKILAQLGVASPTANTDKAVPIDQTELDVAMGNAVDKEAEEVTLKMSAAAKRKRKKKEKQREKKAAAAAASVEEKHEEIMNERTAEKKKVPKHVKEMQETLAKRKEEAERKKRKEEERLKKEEEERLEQEELIRQEKERKRLKKERKKEKVLKKKQEGKLLTGKQKEEARRLEAMRNQFLASAGGLPLTTADTAAPPKRPKYQTKKSKTHSQEHGDTSSNTIEITEAVKKQGGIPGLNFPGTEELEEINLMNVEEKSVVVEMDGTEKDDEEEWEAKSWGEDDFKLLGESLLSDEETDQLETNSEVSSIAQVEFEKGESYNLRSPICCIMGHVDAGKTKLLDCIRGSNVQEGEAGGITQQIGATYLPVENLRDRTRELKVGGGLKVPGLLLIDTPGHESFMNLRSGGSGLCDIAILVVDIMDGIKPQTVESLNLLKMRKTQFIVALNKVDRLYGWKTCRNASIVKAMKQQSKDVQNEFDRRLTEIIAQFKEQGWNSNLYYKIEKKEMEKTISVAPIVPTSAISGEGIPDLLLLLVKWCQKNMVEKLTYSDKVQCAILEVKANEGDGTTIDVVLVNGVLHEGDQIVVCGTQGPIVTTIRALSTPHPMKKLRVKVNYLHHKEIKAAQFIKIAAQDLKHAIAGTDIYVVAPNDDLEVVKELTMGDKKSVMNQIDKSGTGVCVQASTLGSLEALLDFLKTPAVNIPVRCAGIGPVHKKEVRTASVMLEKKKEEYAAILAFDVKVTPDARGHADEVGVRIFVADTIYLLINQFKAYIDTYKEEKKKKVASETVFPCVLKIKPECVFKKKDPFIVGVDVLEGIAKVGTPICIPQKEFIDIGQITRILNKEQPVDEARKGSAVSIEITGSNLIEKQKKFGRHFGIEDELVSHLSRKSIDILKELYWDELPTELRKLVVNMKRVFKI